MSSNEQLQEPVELGVLVLGENVQVVLDLDVMEILGPFLAHLLNIFFQDRAVENVIDYWSIKKINQKGWFKLGVLLGRG